MRVFTQRTAVRLLLPLLVLAAPGSAYAQQSPAPEPSIIVNGEKPPEPVGTAPGPEVKGIISSHGAGRMKVTTADGATQLIALTDSTRIRSGGGLFGSNRGNLTATALLNGLPVTVKTMQAGDTLVASQITFRTGDLRTASMIRHGTAEQFAQQTAATEALRGRMGDIDKYNIRGTTNVYFDTGKAILSPAAKAELCSAASTAEATDNALMLVVGYTDSTGSDEFNQQLSEKRASSVINHLQQACHWKPYRMLTPTGMAKADPLASNDTPEGKAQNRRVAVNVLVSKAVDGM